MSVKTVVCEICGIETTKRKTLSLDALGAGRGRACRTHEEIAIALEWLEEHHKEMRMLEEVNEKLTVMGFVSSIRILNAFHGMSFESLFWNMESKRVPRHIIDKVKAEVMKQGPMSKQEMGETIVDAVWMMRKRAELGLS